MTVNRHAETQRPAKPSLPEGRGPSADHSALCHTLQSADSASGIGLNDALAGDEGLTQN